ncbi:MAG TPA: choice-of-anchor tandem repeat GloVer-containing protein, partial [Blastocatellia bacterium]|nr:choice-of-anchor tandem repeat GloVer-containing protein [Blastocatellia bacterium]
MKPITLRPPSRKIYVLAVCLIALVANVAFGLLTSANTSGITPVQDLIGADNWRPNELIQTPDGSLVGTVAPSQSASGENGKVIRMSSSGQIAALHVFNGEDGDRPSGKLLYAPDGYLYGVATGGGVGDAGVIYKLRPDGSAFEVIHSFDNEEGRAPVAGLVAGPYGYLYGTASQGGAGFGTVFSTSANGQFTVL